MRVIQDSDDDLENDLEADMLPSKDVGASSVQVSNDTSPQPGTGSTESLKRAIESAHRTHLQSQPPNQGLVVGSGPPSSLSLSEHRIKRRKTSADVSPHRSPSRASSRNGPVTYGKKSNSIFRSPSISLLDDHSQTSKSTEIIEEEPWGLEGTMRNDYAQHDPMAMFPEPSSTIPNATFTQQRMLEAVAAPALLGADAETATPYQPEPSIPWSEYLRLTPGDSEEQLESCNKEQFTSQIAPTLTPTVPLVQTPRKTSEHPTSQQNRRGSSVLLKGSPLRNEVLNNNVELAKSAMPQSEIISSFQPDKHPVESINSYRSTQEKLEKPPRRRQSQASLATNFEDDATAIGLPKEQYRPRPSRSRSLKVDVQEPIDYSVKPEKVTRTRRRKTANGVGNRDEDVAPEKVQQICDMGFSPSATKEALLQNNGNVTQTIEWLVNNRLDHDESDHDELAPQSSPKSKTKLKGKTASLTKQPRSVSQTTSLQNKEPEVSHSGTATNTLTKPGAIHDDVGSMASTEMPLDTTPFKSPKVEVVIPLKSPKPDTSQNSGMTKTTDKKPKRRKTTLDHPEPTAGESIVPEATTGKKRGRGRPKKAANVAISTESVQKEQKEIIPEERHTTVLQSVEPDIGPLQNQSDILPGVAHVSNDERIPQRPEVEAFTPPPLSEDTSKPAVSRTSERPTKPASHSPINKGKVGYRVGLSKRARIAPLLRIMKK